MGQPDDHPAPDWTRLGQYVVARRLALGYKTREPFSAASGISTRILGDIETGRREGRFDKKTIAALENTLGWATGSVDTIVNGGEPTLRTDTAVQATAGIGDNITATLTTADEADAVLRKVMRSDRLTDEQKHHVVKLLNAEKEQAERQRAELAEALIRLLADG